MEIHITHAAPRASGGISVRVKITDEQGHSETKSLHLTETDWHGLGVATGQKLTPDQFDELDCAAEYCAALNKGTELLSYGANSRHMLELKLRRHGYDAGLCARVGEELCRRGMIREDDDARAIVRICLRSGYGERRIAMKLKQKGYGDDAVRAALDEVPERVYIDNCADLIRRKYGGVPDNGDMCRKMIAALTRYGYGFGQIKQAIKLLGG